MTTQNTNGNYLVQGNNLTNDQKQLLHFNGMKNPEWVKSHSFWFKDGKPSIDKGYYYPICKSLSFLPY